MEAAAAVGSSGMFTFPVFYFVSSLNCLLSKSSFQITAFLIYFLSHFCISGTPKSAQSCALLTLLPPISCVSVFLNFGIIDILHQTIAGGLGKADGLHPLKTTDSVLWQ